MTIPTGSIRSGPESKTSGSLPGRLGQAALELGDRQRLGCDADRRRSAVPFASPNGARVGLQAEQLAQQRVVADLGMGVEREVVGGEGGLGGQQRPQPRRHRQRERLEPVAPEQAVVDEHELRAGADAPRSRISRLALTPVASSSTSAAPGTWMPFGP